MNNQYSSHPTHGSHRNHRELCHVLAYLYPERSSIQRIAFEAGIIVSRVRLENSALDNWYSVIAEAEKSELLPQLLNIVHGEYGNNTQLQLASAPYRQHATRAHARRDRRQMIIKLVIQCDLNRCRGAEPNHPCDNRDCIFNASAKIIHIEYGVLGVTLFNHYAIAQ